MKPPRQHSFPEKASAAAAAAAAAAEARREYTQFAPRRANPKRENTVRAYLCNRTARRKTHTIRTGLECFELRLSSVERCACCRRVNLKSASGVASISRALGGRGGELYSYCHNSARLSRTEGRGHADAGRSERSAVEAGGRRTRLACRVAEQRELVLVMATERKRSVEHEAELEEEHEQEIE